jgi:hypothetical protein
MENSQQGITFSNRAHIIVSPRFKEALIKCFSQVLALGEPLWLKVKGQEPMAAFAFPGGGSVSIEFGDHALDEATVRRGAWLEIRSDNPPALKQRILEAGLPKVTHPATNTFYFAAPGGQVFGVVSINPSSGELRN